MDGLLVALGVAIVLAATCAFVLEPQLPVVDPRSMRIAPRLDEVPGGWGSASVVAAVGMVLAAGLPRPRGTCVLGSAAGQIAAAVLAACGIVLTSSVTSIWTFGPKNPCRYASCWPAQAQAVAIAAPGLLAALALVGAALLVGKVSWGVRATAPAALWMGAILLLRLVWEPWLLPVLLAPQP